MCGRYVLALRASEVRHQLETYNLPSDSAPEDEETRQSYNFAPGYRGLVYRADTSDRGGGTSQHEQQLGASAEDLKSYKLQPMKWGLIPFWTKRAPDYSSQLKTINCRDDSLIENRGMWTSMKRHKRCIVVAQGFYEWLKKNNGKEKIPHYIKRNDGQLMLMAGLWDCVQYEDSDDKLYSYTIITTSSNKQLSFLHDRMPVILDPESKALRVWLDPYISEWSNELQSCLQPLAGKLDIYPVAKEVGKVGNNSPTFIIPIDSKENKNNIANFFTKDSLPSKIESNEKSPLESHSVELKGEKAVDEDYAADSDELKINFESGTEDNAPLPDSQPKYPDQNFKKMKREHSEDETEKWAKCPPFKVQKVSPRKQLSESPKKPTRKTRSSTKNGSTKKSTISGTPKITSFFGN